jgi:hypothetical protein
MRPQATLLVFVCFEDIKLDSGLRRNGDKGRSQFRKNGSLQ